MSSFVPVPVSRRGLAVLCIRRVAGGALRLALPGAVVVLAACSAESSLNRYVPNIITPYRMDIQQGNFVTQDMVEKLQKGQTQDQVRFILGTPLLTDAFHAQRWDYVFRSAKGWNDPEKHSLIVYFDSDKKLDHWEANDVPPPKALEPVPDNRGFFGRMFGKKPETAAAPVPAGNAVAAADSTSPAENAPATNTPQPPAGSAPAVPAAPTAAEPAPAAPPQPAGAGVVVTPPPAASAVGATPQEGVEKKQPGLMRRMFGWLPGVSTEDSAASVARANSPDNVPMPRPTVSQPPAPPEPPAPAPAPAAAPPVTPAPAPATPAPGNTIAPLTADPTATAPVVTMAPGVTPRPPANSSLSAPPQVPATETPAVVAQAVPSPAGVTPVPVTPPADAAAAPPAPAASPAPAAGPATAPAAPSAVSPDGVLTALERWRGAWQAKNVAAYLAAYAPDFRPPGNLPRARWEAQRRDRLTKPSFINVKVEDPQVTVGRDDVAVVTFNQVYESSLVKESGRKTLRMARYGGDWLIIEESSK